MYIGYIETDLMLSLRPHPIRILERMQTYAKGQLLSLLVVARP